MKAHPDRMRQARSRRCSHSGSATGTLRDMASRDTKTTESALAARLRRLRVDEIELSERIVLKLVATSLRSTSQPPFIYREVYGCARRQWCRYRSTVRADRTAGVSNPPRING